MSDTKKPACADRGAQTRVWLGTPPPGWKPGMRPPCRACGAGCAEPCRTPCDGEVFRGNAEVYVGEGDGVVEETRSVLGMVAIERGFVRARKWAPGLGQWVLAGVDENESDESHAILCAAVTDLASKLHPVQAAAAALRDAGRFPTLFTDPLHAALFEAVLATISPEEPKAR